MGGFRVDGCGTKEYFKKIKYLGEQMCPNCKKQTPFYLNEGKYKVSVFYIPTVTLKQRYAVLCDRCEMGHYVDDAEAMRLLREGKPEKLPDAASGGGAASRRCPQCGREADGAFCGHCGAALDAPAARYRCPSCGKPSDGAFCGQCGAKCVEEGAAATQPKPTYRMQCPNCGKPSDGAFCGHCGARCIRVAVPVVEPRPEPQPEPRPEPEPVPTGWECPLCGTHNEADDASCGLCGLPRGETI